MRNLYARSKVRTPRKLIILIRIKWLCSRSEARKVMRISDRTIWIWSRRSKIIGRSRITFPLNLAPKNNKPGIWIRNYTLNKNSFKIRNYPQIPPILFLIQTRMHTINSLFPRTPTNRIPVLRRFFGNKIKIWSRNWNWSNKAFRVSEAK